MQNISGNQPLNPSHLWWWKILEVNGDVYGHINCINNRPGDTDLSYHKSYRELSSKLTSISLVWIWGWLNIQFCSTLLKSYNKFIWLNFSDSASNFMLASTELKTFKSSLACRSFFKLREYSQHTQRITQRCLTVTRICLQKLGQLDYPRPHHRSVYIWSYWIEIVHSLYI